jgi:hypothetical protein
MWICLSDGFLSIVVDTNDSTRLLVRARRKEHLVIVFGKDQDLTNRIDNWRSQFVRRVGAFVAGKPKKFDFGHFPGSFQSLYSTGTGNSGQVMSR